MNGVTYLVVPGQDKPQSQNTCWNSLFIVKKGLIWVSLKNLTLIGSLLMTVSLLIALVKVCVDGVFVCDLSKGELPFVSEILR